MKHKCVAVWYLSTINVHRNIKCIHNHVLRANRPSGLYNISLQILALLLFSNKAHTGSGWNEFSKLTVTNCQHANMCLYSQITSEPRDRNSSVGIATRLGASQSGFRILAGTRNFLFSKSSRQALGPSRHPIQWISGFFPGANEWSWQLTSIWCSG